MSGFDNVSLGEPLSLAATHVHLDADNCLEVVIMKGKSGEIKHLADHMIAMRGVKHGKLVLTSTGKDLR